MLTIVGSIVFALGMYLFVDSRIRASREAAQAAAAAELRPEQPRAPSLLDAASAVAAPFVAQVGAGHFAQAYQQMAAQYRSMVGEAAFAQACRASPFLAGARAVTLHRLQQTSAGAATAVEARGVLDSTAGTVAIGFVFVQEAGRLRILVVSLAGASILSAKILQASERRPALNA